MLNKIIQFSLQNRLFILIASVLLMIGGLYQAYHTEVDVFPDLNAPTVVVMTEAGGMAAEEVEQLVTFPIETAVNGATSVRPVSYTHLDVYKRQVQGGGVSLNKEKLTAFDRIITADDLLNGKYLLVQRGKKNYFLLIAK